MKTKSKWRLVLLVLLPFGLIAIAYGGLRLHYHLTHWPKIQNPEAILAFATQEFSKNPQERQIPESEWPSEIKRLSPRYVGIDSIGLDIVIHTGGAFRGNTGFWVLREGQSAPKPMSRDVIRPSAIPRIIQYDLYY